MRVGLRLILTRFNSLSEIIRYHQISLKETELEITTSTKLFGYIVTKI